MQAVIDTNNSHDRDPTDGCNYLVNLCEIRGRRKDSNISLMILPDFVSFF